MRISDWSSDVCSSDLIAIEAPAGASVIGRTTEDQMHIGVFWGYVAMMEGLVAKLRAEIGRPTRTIATGGLAVLFDEHTDIFDAKIGRASCRERVCQYV